MSGEARLWNALGDRLDRLAEGGEPAGFWLRDDDAVAPGPALDRLIGMARDAGAPLALAVIPARAGPSLARAVDPLDHVTILQHGFAHADHAAPGAKKSELGPERPVGAVLAELAEGRARLAMFARVQPILVPPWNRIAEPVAARLPELGFKAVSLYGDRDPEPEPARILRLNTHLDPVAWRGDRGFVGRPAALAMLIRRLDRLLQGSADRREPTGILTHHLVHDGETFDFLADLFGMIGNHDAARWLSAESLLSM